MPVTCSLHHAESAFCLSPRAGSRRAASTLQGLIYRVRPEAQSRLTAGYMIFYSIGCATGSIASTLIYALAGWTGVCLLGAAASAVALLFWTLTRRLA